MILILDGELPWGGADGVLSVLENSPEPWVDDLAVLLLGGNPSLAAHSRLHVDVMPNSPFSLDAFDLLGRPT